MPTRLMHRACPRQSCVQSTPTMLACGGSARAGLVLLVTVPMGSPVGAASHSAVSLTTGCTAVSWRMSTDDRSDSPAVLLCRCPQAGTAAFLHIDLLLSCSTACWVQIQQQLCMLGAPIHSATAVVGRRGQHFVVGAVCCDCDGDCGCVLPPLS
jgi:hypothetical protein